ncbi:hypothetical protein EAO70_34305 [Streptomyces sp. adm13(2018)]|uniref:hypothetical protein n=1 Tax=Streptomyces sp. adm13(2018) TaxID=2479007 RepID=UPI0011CE97A7|nr:hypothetical protein [Streptomyces sp. adm13(2018)]TXS09829.1 hypothetical protein EAO70_34305 [Streptomyces sp. adm13(2018)]
MGGYLWVRSLVSSPQGRTWCANLVDPLVEQDAGFASGPAVGFTGHGRWKLLDHDTQGGPPVRGDKPAALLRRCL